MTDARVAETAEALFASVAWLAGRVPGGWSRSSGGVFAAVSGMPVPTLNGVWAPSGAEATTVETSLDAVANAGIPHCLEFPVGDRDLAEFATARGMTRDDDIPLMRLDEEPIGEQPADLVIRRLSLDEVHLHAEIAATGFGVPVEVVEAFVAPRIAAQPGIAYYVGEVGGVPVVTGMGLGIDGRLGVWDIGTLPEHRGRGYGGAITAHIVREGFAAGAEWCWLQSSPAGQHVYAALGFEVVTTWECWVADSSPERE